MRGLIKYTAATATNQQGLWDAFQPWKKQKPWADVLQPGDDVEIYLPYYLEKKPKTKKDKSVSTSKSGIKQTLFYKREMGEIIKFQDIEENRKTYNPFAIFNALNLAADTGLVLRWYPNVIDYPLEYHSCIIEDLIDPKRQGNQMLWGFEFKLIFLPDIQFPSTVPLFV